jgi:hypothetical protein
MYRKMNPKQLEEVIAKVKKEKDIVEILKTAGYGVVEGKDAVLSKIEELASK